MSSDPLRLHFLPRRAIWASAASQSGSVHCTKFTLRDRESSKSLSDALGTDDRRVPPLAYSLGKLAGCRSNFCLGGRRH